MSDDEIIAQIPALIAELRMAQGDQTDWTEELFANAAEGLEVLLRELHARELHHFETEQRLDKQATGLTKEYE